MGKNVLVFYTALSTKLKIASFVYSLFRRCWKVDECIFQNHFEIHVFLIILPRASYPTSSPVFKAVKILFWSFMDPEASSAIEFRD